MAKNNTKPMRNKTVHVLASEEEIARLDLNKSFTITHTRAEFVRILLDEAQTAREAKRAKAAVAQEE